MEQPVQKHQQNDTPAAVLFDAALDLHKQNEYEAAAKAYREVLEIDPRHPHAWRNLGAVLRKTGHMEAALVCLRRSLEIAPDYPETLTNLGNCLAELDDMDAALDAQAKAAAAAPDNITIRKNYAVALRKAGRLEEALTHLEKVLALRPGDDRARWERALVHLHLGRFQEGWEGLEVRWKLDLKERVYPVPRWRGEDLKGKTILVYKEQGFGDTILCARYLPLVKARGARVLFECQKELQRLFRSLPGVDLMGEIGGIQESFDYHVPMLSLPGIFGTDFSSIPPALPVSPAPLPAEARRLLDLGQGRLKVGIVWSGSVTFLDNRKRAVSAAHFLPLAEVPGVQLYSLQKGPREKDLADCGAKGVIIELGPHLRDFSETAAVLNELDLIIMTDSSVAHLAGSMGRPVWNLLNFSPYWLYQMEREDCPWHPSMRLFRQPKPGDWESVFTRVKKELAALSRASS